MHSQGTEGRRSRAGVVQWIPNILTILRVLLLPVLFYLLTRVPPDAPAAASERIWTAALLVLIGATDYLDGVAARRYDAASRFGSAADGMADRLVLVLPLLYFAVADPPAFPTVGLWIPVWLIALDTVTGLGWLQARLRRGEAVPSSHNEPGRVATWVYFALLLWVVAGLPVGGVILLAVLALSLSTASTVLYLRRWIGDAGS